MKNLSKVAILCVVSLIIFASCDQNSGILPSDAISLDNPYLEPIGEEEDFTPVGLEQYEFAGYVFSEENRLGVKGATVEVYEIAKNGQKLAKTMTNANGSFNLKLKNDIDKVTIKVSKRGYEDKITKLTALDDNSIWLSTKRKPVGISHINNVGSPD